MASWEISTLYPSPLRWSYIALSTVVGRRGNRGTGGLLSVKTSSLIPTVTSRKTTTRARSDLSRGRFTGSSLTQSSYKSVNQIGLRETPFQHTCRLTVTELFIRPGQVKTE